MSHRRNSSGNVLIIVLFVIIVMGYLASSLMKVTWSNQSGLTREFLGTKAWFVAQSEAESLFRVQATAICGSGVSQVQRQQEIWVRSR